MDKSVVVARLIGGLGNQMFQYAAGRAIAKRCKVPLLLDISGFEHYDLRRYELDEFSISAQPATLGDLRFFGVVPSKPTLFNRVLKRFGLVYGQSSILRESGFQFNAAIESATPPVFIDGYWQSEKYFDSLGDLLRAEFSLRSSPDAANSEMAAKISSLQSRAVSLHIRRGDYVTNPQTAKFHGVCSMDYYRAAIAYIAERVSNPHFFIFSDDGKWVRENLEIGYETTLVQVNGPDRGIFDMMLMKSCSHHVIANSSFSWWGAWLNPSREKIVIAPKRWFNEASHDTCDLLPAEWVKL